MIQMVLIMREEIINFKTTRKYMLIFVCFIKNKATILSFYCGMMYTLN